MTISRAIGESGVWVNLHAVESGDLFQPLFRDGRGARLRDLVQLASRMGPAYGVLRFIVVASRPLMANLHVLKFAEWGWPPFGYKTDGQGLVPFPQQFETLEIRSG